MLSMSFLVALVLQQTHCQSQCTRKIPILIAIAGCSCLDICQVELLQRAQQQIYVLARSLDAFRFIH